MYEVEELKQHYDAQLSELAEQGLGMKNCDESPIPRPQRFLYDQVLPDVRALSRGFKTPLPNVIEGCSVLLVGCGSGEDAFVAAKLVGDEGKVVGVDPDEAAIAVARQAVDDQVRAFGAESLSVSFEVGYPERLDLAGLEDESFDCVVFNMALNLAMDMSVALREFWRVLKPGGELYGSIVTADRRFKETPSINESVSHPILRDATYFSDFRRWLSQAGWPHYRYMYKRRVYVEDERERELLKNVDLVVRAIRTFKLDALEERCENYGHSIEYLGEAPGCPQFLEFDDSHRFFVDVPLRVCRNTYEVATSTRFARWFLVREASEKRHFGMYDYCSYNNRSIDSKKVIEYLPDGLEACVNCSHHDHCIVDGHCQHVNADGSKYLDWEAHS